MIFKRKIYEKLEKGCERNKGPIRTYLKCYMGDTGLLVSHAFTEAEIETEDLYRQLILGRLSVNEGMIFENAVMQALVCNGYNPFFYTHYHTEKHRNDIKIDFLISNKSKTRYKIYLIEVKSSEKLPAEGGYQVYSCLYDDVSLKDLDHAAGQGAYAIWNLKFFL